MAKKPRFLFVCENSPSNCQMAEGFVRFYGGASVSVESAGPEVDAVNPYCQWAMNETGVDVSFISTSPLETKNLSSYSHIVTLCGEAREKLGSLSGAVKVDHWEIPNPAQIRGKPADIIGAFRAIRNQIETRVKGLLSQALSK